MIEQVYVDANVIVYALDADAPFHVRSIRFWKSVVAGEVRAAVSPQVLHEAFVALTRRVARPLDPKSVAESLLGILDTPGLAILRPGRKAATESIRMASERNVGGPGIYDIAHIAIMQEHDLRRIITFNRRHFEGYKGIESVEPSAE